MTTTQDIMKLARAYAKAYMSFQEAGELRALQSAVDALVAERDALQQANEAFDKRQEWWNERMITLEAEKAAMQATEMPEPIMLMIPNAKESAVFTLDQLQQAHAAGYAKGLAQQARLDDAGRQEPVTHPREQDLSAANNFGKPYGYAVVVAAGKHAGMLDGGAHTFRDEAEKVIKDHPNFYDNHKVVPLYTRPATQPAALQPYGDEK